MVELCRQKGLDAHVVDVLNLDFPPASVDAAYSLNCLLHVPNADLPAALATVRDLLRPGGLFYLGLFGGGEDSEGLHDEDNHTPPRFFAHRSNDKIQEFVRESFEIVDFHTILDRHTFQSLTLRRV